MINIYIRLTFRLISTFVNLLNCCLFFFSWSLPVESLLLNYLSLCYLRLCIHFYSKTALEDNFICLDFHSRLMPGFFYLSITWQRRNLFKWLTEFDIFLSRLQFGRIMSNIMRIRAIIFSFPLKPCIFWWFIRAWNKSIRHSLRSGKI